VQLGDGHERGAAGGHDVFDHHDALPGLSAPLHGLVGAIALLALAHDHERLAAGERHRRHDGDGAELRPGEDVERLVGRQLLRQAGGDVAQQVRLGREEVLVEIELAPPARTKEEVALQIAGVEQALAEIAQRAPFLDRVRAVTSRRWTSPR
jgi:hypothetical protein